MKQVPFDSDKYFLRFDRKYVLHNQDKKISPMQLKELRKVCQKAILANFCMFYSLWQIGWKEKSSLVRKILEFGFNPHTSHTLAQTFTLTLLRSISKDQMHKCLRGQKWGFI